MGAYFTISSIIYTAILIYFFFTKNTLKNVETKIYKILLITTLVGLCLDAFSFFAYELGLNPDTFLYQTLAKGVLLYFLIWIGSFTYYIYAISYSDMENEDDYHNKLQKFGNILRIFISLAMVLSFVIPITFEIKNDVIFPTGIGVDITYLTTGICLFTCFVVAFKNIKHIVIKKYTPLFATAIFVVLSALVQRVFPELFLVNFGIALVVLILYFSIENPDIKIINELKYSKELLKKANKATNKGLSSLTEEIAKPLELLHEFGSKNIDSENEEQSIKELKKLQQTSLELVDQINGIIELTRIENEDDELKKCNYNVLELYGEIKNLVTTQNNKMGKEGQIIIDEEVRKVLYGDPIKIKRTVTAIYRYLLEHDKVKKLILKIDDTNTAAITRLKFAFIFKKGNFDYENLFMSEEIDVKIINRLIELQDAKLEIKTLEDKVYIEFLINQKYVSKYEVTNHKFHNMRLKEYHDCHKAKVLIIDDNQEKINNLIELLKPYNLTIETAHNYQEYENKIYNNDIWQLIFLDDMMPDSDKFEFLCLSNQEKEGSLEKIEKLINEKLPLVIMVTPNNEMNNYQGDYLLKPIKVRELDQIIRKYIK